MENNFKNIDNFTNDELIKSQKIQDFVNSLTSFGYSSIDDIIKDLYDEIEELKIEIKTNNINRIKEELGDVIFVLCNLANKYNINIEEAIHYSNEEYKRRWLFIENRLGSSKINKNTKHDIFVKLWKESKK